MTTSRKGISNHAAELAGHQNAHRDMMAEALPGMQMVTGKTLTCYHKGMRHPKLHRIDQASVDYDTEYGNCAVCGRTRVKYKVPGERWACWEKEQEAHRRYNQKHRNTPAGIEAKRKYYRSASFARSMLKYWQRQLDLREAAETSAFVGIGA